MKSILHSKLKTRDDVIQLWNPKRRKSVHHISWLNRFNPERRFLIGRAYLMAKRVMDVLIILLTVPVWLPLIMLAAILVKMESPRGPVFFNQKRAGKSGRLFRMYKFRTMVPNAEELKKKFSHLNELKWPDFKIKNDPRISKVGHFLRKTSLDELPQIFNVLRGNMSLVGPRPTSFFPDTYSLWQTERLDVYPGITGLWQIIGRGSTEFDTRIRLDIAYMERRCLWLDVQILFRTFTSIMEQRGTY